MGKDLREINEVQFNLGHGGVGDHSSLASCNFKRKESEWHDQSRPLLSLREFLPAPCTLYLNFSSNVIIILNQYLWTPMMINPSGCVLVFLLKWNGGHLKGHHEVTPKLAEGNKGHWDTPFMEKGSQTSKPLPQQAFCPNNPRPGNLFFSSWKCLYLRFLSVINIQSELSIPLWNKDSEHCRIVT